ncbi:MAG: universal stress protein [Flavobacteriaceae bacterium]|nr:universal stress protein [Flavobacteriaceae bacterium]MDH3796121.1 universal stress protein [Flavobacteriaceae bacterium]
MSLRKIVIPTDFSANAFNALSYATQLFKYQRCDFYLLHAYADEVYDLKGSATRSELDDTKEVVYQKTKRALRAEIRKIRDQSPNPKHNFEAIAAFGTLTDEINDLVNQFNLDLAIMGTRGETNDRTITFGSNTLQVLKYVQCPVLAIPEGYQFHAPRELLFPSNYLTPYKRRELKLLCELSGSYRANIHMLYIDPTEKLSLRQEDNLRFLKENLKKAELSCETTKEKDKTIAITKYIVHNDIDMLVMVNTRHSHFEDMIHKSTIDQIGLHLKVPLLVLQNLSR